MGLSLPHLIVVALIILLLFGRGKISDMMGDFGKGIKSFKQGMADEENRPADPPQPRISAPETAAQPSSAASEAKPEER